MNSCSKLLSSNINYCLLDVESTLFHLDIGIHNIAKRERNRGAKQLDALMKVRHEVSLFFSLYNLSSLLFSVVVLLTYFRVKLFFNTGISCSFKKIHGNLPQQAISTSIWEISYWTDFRWWQLWRGFQRFSLLQ